MQVSTIVMFGEAPKRPEGRSPGPYMPQAAIEGVSVGRVIADGKSMSAECEILERDHVAGNYRWRARSVTATVAVRCRSTRPETARPRRLWPRTFMSGRRVIVWRTAKLLFPRRRWWRVPRRRVLRRRVPRGRRVPRRRVLRRRVPQFHGGEVLAGVPRRRLRGEVLHGQFHGGLFYGGEFHRFSGKFSGGLFYGWRVLRWRIQPQRAI